MMKTVELPLMVRLLQQVEFPHKLGIMGRLFDSTLIRHEICWISTAAGRPWKLDLRSATHRWMVYGKYQGPGFHAWAKKTLPKNGVIVDSGANIGQMLIYLVNFIPQGRLLAFEPNTEAAQWLGECLQKYPELPVELLRLGLGATPGKAFLNDESHPEFHGAQSFISETGGLPIHIVRLEEEIAKRGIERVNLWKLDVEGYEISALEGARTLLARHAIDALYVEIFEENRERIKSYLSDFGYHCYAITDQGSLAPMEPDSGKVDGLFLPSSG
jgi:FkbM family methyltransferase